MSDDKILQFPGSDPMPDETIVIARAATSFCQHDSISLDIHSRSINCVACGAVLEPFNFLLTNANALTRAWRDYKEVSNRLRELLDRVEYLKKEKARLDGQIKRQKEKIPVINTRTKD